MQQNKSPKLGRRQWLTGSAGVLAATGLGSWTGSALAQAGATTAPAASPAAKPLPPYIAWKDPAAMIVHSTNTVETRRSAFGTSVVTPSETVYIRNNLPPPGAEIVADRDAWQMSVEGVKSPRTFTVGELKSLGLETLPMVLQCSGNGRGLFPSKPSGTPWQVGAAACVIWSGVPVRLLAEMLGGVADGMVYMTGTGGEKLPEGLDPKSVMVERSVPLAAMADALLAWEMNGVPISLAHGGPLRLIVPGYNGVNNVKYLARLAFTREQSDAAIQKTGYRMSPLGEKGDPGQPSIWEMSAKSWINSPGPESGPLRAGKVQVKGVGFGGMHAVKAIEVSADEGKTWKTARLVGPDLGKYAWRQFVFPMELPAGTHTLMCRAIDSRGTVQAENRVENTGGYSNSSWRDHAVKVVAV
jgi:DMSO/TMAO reductase YedYZ molybdopterin-dependent catalytic subunit